MKRKAIIPILLSLLLLASSSSLFLTFIIKHAIIRNEIKDRIKSGLPKTSLTLIKKYNEKGRKNLLLKWFRENEFSFNGKMYDVVTEEKHGDTIWYYCLMDEKESSLFNKMGELTRKEIRNDKGIKGLFLRISNFLSQNFVSVITQNVLQIRDIKTIQFAAYFFSVKPFIHKPDTPPPENQQD